MTTIPGEIASTIEALHDEFVRNFNAGNIDRLVQVFYAEDAVLLPPNYPAVQGRSAIAGFFKGMVAAGVGDLSIQPGPVGVSGDLAYATGTYNLGKPGDKGKFLEVYRRQADGSWKAVADMFSSDQPAG